MIAAMAGAAVVSTALEVGAKALGAGLSAAASLLDQAKTKAEASAAAQTATLADIRQKGVYAWAQGQKFDSLTSKITQQVMTARKLDAASLAAMDPTQRASAESSATAEIATRTKQAMQNALEGQAQMAAKAGKPPAPMVIDIKV
jgi:hypothetical protein